MSLANYYSKFRIYFIYQKVRWGKNYNNWANKIYNDIYFYLLQYQNLKKNLVLQL